jgi:hypothetical protein
MQTSNILVACPNDIVKEYSFQRWITNVTSLTYPSYDILVVDNSPRGELSKKYGSQVPIIELDTGGIEDQPIVRMNRSMEVIRKYFLAGDYSHWMNIESDIIPQLDVIELSLDWGRHSDWISHAYPFQGENVLIEHGIGCSLLSRHLIENFSWHGAESNALPDNWLWQQVRPYASEFPTMELWGYIEVTHLGE